MVSCCRFNCQVTIHAPSAVSAHHGRSRWKKVAEKPQSVYGESERHGRPLDAALERRKVYDLHERASPADAQRITYLKR